ncbi:MAG: hypothetical protein GEV08_05335 [Acidimicrobiia bacterium]|nr:hypothetical protein [Acidimicrobiia bacterium]
MTTAAERPAPVGRHHWRDLVLEFLGGVVVLAVIVAVLPGLSVTRWYAVPTVVAVAAVVGVVARPVLWRLAGLLGLVGVLLVGVFGHAVVVDLAMVASPHFESRGFWTTFLAAWLYAAGRGLLDWALVCDADEVFLARVVRDSRHERGPPTEEPGVVFVQLDGLPAPLLDFGLRSGNFPTLARWVRSGSHRWRPWTASVPSTTPVSQAGILHGRNDGIPAFRWYEKELGRLVVANHPADAALIEARVSDGTGLLAGGGVSIGNLFTGDAAESYLVMSRTRLRPGGLGPTKAYRSFFSDPAGFVRGVTLAVGEMVKELFQARQQARRGIEPRVDRGGSYILLRAVTNVLMRDLSSALVVRAMVRGAPSIYVDFVDYDEIAHHAGVARAESMDALVGLDRVLGLLERAAVLAPRPYHFVVLSDHGQSQGPTFRQRHDGRGLEDVVRDLLDQRTHVVAATSRAEAWGPANMLLGHEAEGKGVSSTVVRSALDRRARRGPVTVGPTEQEQAAVSAHDSQAEAPDLVVVGSGNLGGVWFANLAGRVGLEALEDAHPGFVDALAHTEGIGFVVVATSDRGPVAIGARGRQWLADGMVEGEGPLAPFGPRARVDLARVAGFANAPDLYVHSDLDPATDEVSAFEELVGSHGGLGGWQNQAVLVHPAGWTVPPDLLEDGELVGAPCVHQVLVTWLERHGPRRRGPITAGDEGGAALPGDAPRVMG